MKVLAINSSFNKDTGNTALILNPFLEGMKEAGAEVELFYMKDLKIGFCRGCLKCWTKNNGTCIEKDDMQDILPKLAEADVWVFATPLYADGMSAQMKVFIDRMLPNLLPRFELRDDHCRHPLRGGVQNGKIVLVSNCGFWEMDNFTPLIAHIIALCKNVKRDFGGALLRPHGPALKVMAKRGRGKKVIYAAKKAGHQLVENGCISIGTLKDIRNNLLPRCLYKFGANRKLDK